MTMVRKYGEAAGAQIVCCLDQRVIEAFQARDERNHHEQQRGVDESDQYGGIVIQQFDRYRSDTELDEQRRQHAGLAQQYHPAQRSHRLADPEWNEAQHEQQRAGRDREPVWQSPTRWGMPAAASARWRRSTSMQCARTPASTTAPRKTSCTARDWARSCAVPRAVETTTAPDRRAAAPPTRRSTTAPVPTAGPDSIVPARLSRDRQPS